MGGHQIVGGIGIEGEGQVGDIDKPGRWWGYVLNLHMCCIYVRFMRVQLYSIDSKFLAPFLLGAHRVIGLIFPSLKL